MSVRIRLAGMVGNLLDHYDTALFGLLAPFIAPLFFDEKDPITALILTYGMLPLGLLTRPLGALFFGWIGDRWGRREALFYSLLGMAVATVSIGLLPTYRDVGMLAPVLLCLGKMLQSFFAAGEGPGGAIFVLENTESSKRGLMSGIYDVSSIGGALIASGLVTFLATQGHIETGWRILFWIGGSTSILGIFIRRSVKDERPVQQPSNWFQSFKENKGALLSIVLAAGFSYTTYSLAFTLMNGYVPLITSCTKADVMKVNTVLLVADMFLLPCFGYLANRFGKERVMLWGAGCSVIGAVPLFAMIDHSSIGVVIVVRSLIILFGVAFAAPYHAWAIERVASQSRYTVLSLGSALGSQLIGVPTSAICLWLYRTTNWSWAPGLYLMAVGLAAGWAVYSLAPQRQKAL